MRICKLFILISMTLVLGCGEDDKKDEANGAPIGAPEVKPPVERNTPTGFSASLRLAGEETTAEERVINVIQGYLAPSANDAVGALQRLGAIDDRMAELDMRTQTSPQRICLLEDAKAYTLAATLPGEDTFPMSFQCQENLDSGAGGAEESQLAFGLNATDLFLMERSGGYDNAVLAKSSLDGTSTEFWQLGTGQSNNYIHLRAEDGVGMEMTAAGTAAITVDCGIHMKSNADFVYVEGYDTVNSVCGTDLITFCLAAGSLETTDVSDCTDAELDTFTLDTLTVAKVNAVDPASETIIKTPISGFIDFTKGVEEPTE